jgi:hypothetical protein
LLAQWKWRQPAVLRAAAGDLDRLFRIASQRWLQGAPERTVRAYSTVLGGLTGGLGRAICFNDLHDRVRIGCELTHHLRQRMPAAMLSQILISDFGHASQFD